MLMVVAERGGMPGLIVNQPPNVTDDDWANASLIAAAPDLLEALAFYVAICGNTAHSITRESAQEAHAKATAALKKARGE